MKRTLFSEIKGQGIVEFALILPILLLIVFATIDLSRLAYHKAVIDQAAKEALRMASVGKDMTSITERVNNLVQPLSGDTPATVSFTPAYTSSLKMGDALSITITYSIEYITPLAGIFGNTAQIQAVYHTRIETPPS